MADTAHPATNQLAQVVTPTDQFGQLITIVDRLVSNPELDLDRLSQFLTMARELRAEQAEVAFNNDLALLQAEIPKIDQSGYNTNTKSSYAKAADVMEPLRPVLSRHGFSIIFKTETSKDSVSVTATLRHNAGHKEENVVTLPLDTGPGRNTVQAVGSSLEYASRYAVNKLLNITSRKNDGDDDGNGTSTSDVASRAIQEINLCSTADELKKWHAEKSEGVLKMVNRKEGDQIVALWNTRRNKLKTPERA